jgi:mannose-6-phosphate isomerase-like protein (cupin superfamily)
MTDVHRHEDAVPWTAVPDAAGSGLRVKALLGDPAGASPFAFGLAELPPGATLPRHATRQAEIDLVLSGRAHLRSGEHSAELTGRACVYFPPGAPRALEALGPEPLRYAYTFATERLGGAIERRFASGPEPATGAAWVHWDRAMDWAPVEPSKGLRIRVKRLLEATRRLPMIAGVFDLDAPIHYTRHFHDQPEVYYVLAGEGVVYVGDDEHRVRRGSALYIGGRVVHGADSLGAEALSIFYVYGCESTGHDVNWTPVEEIYSEPGRARHC